MESESIEKILSNEQFIKELEQAIDAGKSVDYEWNGEDEVRHDVFETDAARNQVMELLKKYFIRKP